MARLIDADALLQAIKKADEADPDLATCWSRGSIRRIIEGLPTIEAAPVVHGHWREYTRSALVSWKNGEPVWVDRAVYYCDGCSFGTIIKHNYCPRCGQKMEGCVSDG